MNPLTLLNSLPGALAQGLIWGIMAIGVAITYKILDYADLTVDNSLCTGGAVAAVCIIGGMNPLLALLCAVLAGALAGLCTGLLHTVLGIPAILSGILTQLALYSVNLRIMGKANVSLLGKDTAFTLVESNFGVAYSQAVLLVGVLACVLFSVLMYWFFGTEIGAAIRATGYNPQMIRAQGVDTNIMLLIGLFFSNALVAVAGALVAQSNGFADVGMGVGTIVIGLASVIIGEVLFGTRSFKNSLISVILGSIVYRLVIAIVLQMGMPPNDLKLFTAVLVAIALSLPMVKGKFQSRKAGI